ncbi:hypothetical protein TI04_08690 [Achromatium sp. WMS2]|nr:hypothetical protein TI04_08690 [Achromatium sp. WMS2]
MSHFTQVQTQIQDLVLLEEALRQLNYEFETGEDLVIHGYQGETANGQLVIRAGGGYDIGFQRQPDQSYTVNADWWGVKRNSPIRKEDFINALNKTYAHLAIKRQALQQGLIIEEEKILPNGEIELILSEPM